MISCTFFCYFEIMLLNYIHQSLPFFFGMF
nr:MAG TPA: hypothetical protein [Caudoviricetes sp.]